MAFLVHRCGNSLRSWKFRSNHMRLNLISSVSISSPVLLAPQSGAHTPHTEIQPNPSHTLISTAAPLAAAPHPHPPIRAPWSFFFRPTKTTLRAWKKILMMIIIVAMIILIKIFVILMIMMTKITEKKPKNIVNFG